MTNARSFLQQAFLPDELPTADTRVQILWLLIDQIGFSEKIRHACRMKWKHYSNRECDTGRQYQWLYLGRRGTSAPARFPSRWLLPALPASCSSAPESWGSQRSATPGPSPPRWGHPGSWAASAALKRGRGLHLTGSRARSGSKTCGKQNQPCRPTPCWANNQAQSWKIWAKTDCMEASLRLLWFTDLALPGNKKLTLKSETHLALTGGATYKLTEGEKNQSTKNVN